MTEQLPEITDDDIEPEVADDGFDDDPIDVDPEDLEGEVTPPPDEEGDQDDGSVLPGGADD